MGVLPMKEAKIGSVSWSSYPKDTINVSVHYEGNYTTFQFQDEEVNQVLAIVWKIIEKKKQEMAQAVLNIQTPLMIEASSGKIVESGIAPYEKPSLDDEIPF
jgi:hypothetical protein